MKKAYYLLALILILASLPVLAVEEARVDVIVNGYNLNSDLQEIRGDRAFVPLRAIAEKLGAEVSYDEETKEVSIKKDKIVSLIVNDNKARIGDEILELDEKTYIKEDRLMVPIRFISESLGEEVNWDSKSRCVIIGTVKGREVGKDFIEIHLDKIKGSIFLPKNYEDEIVFTTENPIEGDLTIMSKKLIEYLENNPDSEEVISGVIAVVNLLESPVLDNHHSYILNYNPQTNIYTTVSYPLKTSFPEEIQEEIGSLQEKYLTILQAYRPD